ncbi:MAG: chemotaxis protein CheX [Magnetococcales bacterium]|nr:chemotaxis protein CheX [Magnetococcales bacterium]
MEENNSASESSHVSPEEAAIKLIDGLQTAVIQVLTTMAMEDVKYTGREEVANLTLRQEVGGLIRLYGGASEGMVGLASSRTVVAEIVSRIVGLPPDSLDQEDLLDGIAELANMVCGSMKSKAQVGYQVSLSPPVAIIGRDYTARWKTLNPTWVLKFLIDGSEFEVYASF